MSAKASADEKCCGCSSTCVLPVPVDPVFDVLQVGWSDSTFSAKWARLEAEEEAGAEDDLTVVETEDRFEDFVGL